MEEDDPDIDINEDMDQDESEEGVNRDFHLFEDGDSSGEEDDEGYEWGLPQLGESFESMYISEKRLTVNSEDVDGIIALDLRPYVTRWSPYHLLSKKIQITYIRK